MKKFLSIFAIVLLCLFCFAGCEGGNSLRTVSFYNITSAGSDKYTVKVVFTQDERVDNKHYDIQIKMDGNKTISIGKQFEEPKKVELLTDEWYSLTTLLLDEPNTETFTLGKDAVELVYIFTSNEKAKVTFRAVVGGVEDNAEGTGQIITGTQVCSEEFVVETK